MYQNRPVIYIGGPLDGQEVPRTGKRWSTYRDNEGNVISAYKGDTELMGRPEGQHPRKYYVRQTEMPTPEYFARPVYVFMPDYHQWRKLPNAA